MKKLILSISLPFLMVAFLIAQSSSKATIFQLFQTDDYLSITLESDYKKLEENKDKDEYQPAVLTYTDEKGELISWDLEIKPRGNMRRRICTTPPLKLKFNKSDLKEQGLAKIKTLEMVDICKSTKSYEQYVLREYVAYKLYNMLTDNSFRVQLVKVDYKNNANKCTPMDGFGILIENNDEMAKRLEGKILDPASINRNVPDSQEKELFCLFQYMIGNTDWWFSTAHNLDIFSRIDSVFPIPIPYDFDYSGFINAPYSIPNDRTPLKYVTERYYQGPCMPLGETKKTIQIFLDKKEEMLSYCREFPYFNRESRKHTVKFLESFFEIIERDTGIKRKIVGTCGHYR